MFFCVTINLFVLESATLVQLIYVSKLVGNFHSLQGIDMLIKFLLDSTPLHSTLCYSMLCYSVLFFYILFYLISLRESCSPEKWVVLAPIPVPVLFFQWMATPTPKKRFICHREATETLCGTDLVLTNHKTLFVVSANQSKIRK